jgi:PilZ domain-containing protein
MRKSKNSTICFRTSEDLRNALEKISKEERRSVSSTIKTILYKYVEGRNELKYVKKDRRNYPRKIVGAPALIKEFGSKDKTSQSGIVLDISLKGFQISIPNDHQFELREDIEGSRISVVFTLPDSKKPINVLCAPKWINPSDSETKIGAFLVDTDYASNQALQNYLLN